MSKQFPHYFEEFSMKSFFFVGLGLAMALAITPANGDMLTPGVPITGAGSGGVGGPITLVASTSGTFNTVPGSGNLGVQVNYTEAVVKEVGGTLDFLYQFTNVNGGPDTTDGLTQTTAIQFPGLFTYNATTIAGSTSGISGIFSTPVGSSGTAGTGSNPLTTVLLGQEIKWTYGTTLSNGNFLKGDVSAIFDIQTTATAYNTAGFVGAADGSNNSVTPSYEPVPEPSMFTGLAGLVAMGGASCVGMVWRRKPRSMAQQSA
jgi:hypothetical protein